MPAPKQTVLISGANTGIGLAAATQLAKQHGYHVIIGSRSLAAGEAAAAALVKGGCKASAVRLDVTDDGSIKEAVKEIEGMTEGKGLDVLINNAGVLLDGIPALANAAGGHNEEGEKTKNLSMRELFTQTLSVNTTGAACLTEACLPLLRKAPHGLPPRIVFVSSRMGSLTEATNKETMYYNADYRAYDCSKAALNMLALNYMRILEGEGGLVNVVCPGLVSTKLTGNTEYGSTTEMGAKRIVDVAVKVEGGETGTFSDRGGKIPW